MEKLTLDEILKAVNGKLIVKGTSSEYKKVSTDTRKIEKESIFIALKGENFNGNEFILEACKKGANLCIISEKKFNEDDLKEDTSIILVKNTNEALLKLAKYYRSKLDIKIIGITGSTGKTSTKDLMAASLSEKYKVFKTKGNFNNEIGMPLMVLSLDNSYDVAVLEMGMSNFNEIHKLADVARPDIAIITNVGVSHIEYLKTRENILKAKMEITDFFTKDNILIINGENDLLSKVYSNEYKIIKIGINGNMDYSADNIILNEDYISYNIKDKLHDEEDTIKIKMPGKHNIYNSLLAIAAARELGVNYDFVKKGFNNLEYTSMRLDIKRGDKFCIINDSYNSSPDSVKAAIDVLANLKGKRKIAILGTMRELGTMSYELHKEVAMYAKDKGIDYLFTLGEFNNAFKEGYKNEKTFKAFSNKESLNVFLKDFIKKDDIILVKASRTMQFESVVSELNKINY